MMKKVLVILIYLYFLQKAEAQTISVKGKETFTIYTVILNNLSANPYVKTFPNTITVSYGLLSAMNDYLTNPITKGIQDYVGKPEWSYVKNIDLVNYLRISFSIKTKKLSLALAKDKRIVKNAGYGESFSPVMFAKDATRAVVVYNKHSSTEVYEEAVYYLSKVNDKWQISQILVPYLI